MASGRRNSLGLALALSGIMAAGCTQTTNSARPPTPLPTLERCAAPVASILVVDGDAPVLPGGVSLPPPGVLMRVLMQASGCFDTIPGAGNAKEELERLKLQPISSAGRRPSHVISLETSAPSPESGGAATRLMTGGGSSLFPSGLLGGSATPTPSPDDGLMKISEVLATLSTYAVSEERQTMVRSAARVTDLTGQTLTTVGLDIPGFAATPGYGSASEGRLIAAAAIDVHNRLVAQLRAAGGPGAGASRVAPAPGSVEAKQLGRAIQTELARLGHYRGGVDGDVGPMTKAAISAFQRAQGVPNDPEPTPELLRQLQAAKPSQQPPAQPGAGSPTTPRSTTTLKDGDIPAP